MTASPKEILSESPDNFYHMGGVRKSAPPPPIFIPPKINQVQANRELSSSTTTSMSVTPQKPSHAPRVIGKKRKPNLQGGSSRKMVKTIKSTLKINVAGVGGVPTTGPLSASAKPKSMDQLPKRTPGRVAKAKVTVTKAPKAKVTKARK